ncbi:nitroreductase [Chloroflexota bacterium]
MERGVKPMEKQLDIIGTIRARKSIRSFLPRPVPKQVLEEVLELAARSPSRSNTQPWEVIAIGREVMEQVSGALVQAALSPVSPDPDIPYTRFEEPYSSRRRELGYMLYEILGINREDKQARDEWALKGMRFFDAPNCLLFCLDRELGPWSLLDLGLFAQSVMLASLAFGLGCCSSANVTGYPRVLREILNIPDKKWVVFGMAIGYPDWQHTANKLESPREPAANFTRWHGF